LSKDNGNIVKWTVIVGMFLTFITIVIGSIYVNSGHIDDNDERLRCVERSVERIDERTEIIKEQLEDINKKLDEINGGD